jgi:hypothetical protein
MDRRQFLRRGIGAIGAGAVLPSLTMVTGVKAGVAPGVPGDSPYGPLRSEPDENGLLLPEGFTSRIVAVAGETVGDTDYAWHLYPDGAATIDDGDGGYYYVQNSEVFDFMKAESGGVSVIHFDADGAIIDAYRILEGSNSNCAGGPTPWGTWLSGEENFGEIGRIWECDPTGERPAVAHPAMGLFTHEAAAVDPVSETVYLTQDLPDGLLYRYTPASYPDLSAGILEAAIIADDGAVTWGVVADPEGGATNPTRLQVPGARTFNGGEGLWYFDGWIYFTSKGDHSVHGIDLRNQVYRLIWQGDPVGLGVEGATLSHVDNITVNEGTGDLMVAEDGGNMELVIITPDGAVAPFVRVVGAGHEVSEMTGPVFSPRRDRLYFSSQRGPTPRALGEILDGLDATVFQGGMTFEISGPFRGIAEPPAPPTTEPAVTDPPVTEPPVTDPVATDAPAETVPSPVTTLTAAAEAADAAGRDDDGDDGTSPVVPIAIGTAVVVAAVGGIIALRNRGSGGDGAKPAADTSSTPPDEPSV